MSESLITKAALAAALKELASEKTFQKISVQDITKRCGLNRQTFYYHFQDKYELVDWIYYNEGFLPLMNGITFDNWHIKLKELLELIKREQDFYVNTLKNDNHCFKEYLLKITITLFNEGIQEMDVEHILKEEEKQFFAEFLSFGICGIVIHWIETGMKEEPKKVVNRLKYLAINSEKMAYIRYCEENIS